MGTFWPSYPIASFSPSQQVTIAASVICVFSFIFIPYCHVLCSEQRNPAPGVRLCQHFYCKLPFSDHYTMRHTRRTLLCSFQLSLLRKGSLENHFQKITGIIEDASHAILAACGELDRDNGPESQAVEGPGGSESGTAFCALPVLSRALSQSPQAPGSLRGSKPF